MQKTEKLHHFRSTKYLGYEILVSIISSIDLEHWYGD